MSDEAKLRRRIECVMINAEDRNGGEGTYKAAAQAVIDDLNLHVKARNGDAIIISGWAGEGVAH